MRRTVFFILLFFFLYTSLAAQSDKKKGGWAATFCGALIPISQPGLGIQPGVEYRFNNRFSLLAEITIRANSKNSKDSSELNKQYMRYKTELRYNFFSKKEKSQLYAGLQISRASRSFINKDGFYFDKGQRDKVYYYDQASIRSPVATVSLQFGTIISYKRFAFDIFGGAGARFIHTSITDITNPVTGVRSRGGNGLSFTASYSFLGNVTMLHLNGGIRLMWHFYQLHQPKK
jgi:hypothetical protein